MTGSAMKRWARPLGTTLAAVTILGGVAVWDAAFRTPPINRFLIPDTLVAADTPAGQQLLSEKGFLSDYEGLTRAFESQSRPGFCGVASSVVVLNALNGGTGQVTQSTFFTERASKVRTSLQVTFGGMTLEQLGALLRAHGATVTVHYASATSLDAFRAIAQQNLSTPSDFMLVNYERAALGQDKTGHISPIAAYNAKSDRLLILDVAAHKYPSVWVSTEAVWKAMNTVDSTSGEAAVLWLSVGFRAGAAGMQPVECPLSESLIGGNELKRLIANDDIEEFEGTTASGGNRPKADF